VQDGDDPQGLFFRRINNQIIAHPGKTKRPRCEVGPPSAHVRERHKSANRRKDFLDQTVSSVNVVDGNELPDAGNLAFRDFG
jgi:hypothetical protein